LKDKEKFKKLSKELNEKKQKELHKQLEMKKKLQEELLWLKKEKPQLKLHKLLWRELSLKQWKNKD
jgi:hypothetical protein